MTGEIRRVSLLTSGKKLAWRRDGADVLVALPVTPPDDLATVVKLEHQPDIHVDATRSLLPGLANTFESVTGSTIGKTVLKKHSWMQEFGN